ncbi:MAG: hypothetical protein IPM54_19330 [Polyangiaceae bacterium]|nr:hypothetical protein [Polyangiaceae bacterium]
MDRFPSGFAVVDVETTGLRWRADRIIEVAVVRLDAAGNVVSEFSTLVFPERNPGASHIHGLSVEDLQGAPRFGEILSELLRHLDGAVFVGHNVQFDASFLREELLRAGIVMPRVPVLCTRDLSQTVLPKLGEYRLAACCRAFGIAQGPEHQALEDARATAKLFVRLWNEDIIQRDAPRDIEHARSVEWPSVDGPTRVYSREDAAKNRIVESSRMGELVASLPEGTTTNDIGGYLALLDDMLEDRHVTEEEAASAKEYIHAAGLLRDDVVRAHRTYLTNVARAALEADLAQGIGSADVAFVTRLLGLSEDDKTNALTNARDNHEMPLRRPSKPLQPGTTVCFTGDPVPSKSELTGRAVAAGLVVKESVTKKLDLLVVDQPQSMSAKAQKARSIGTRIMAVPVFLMHLKAMR